MTMNKDVLISIRPEWCQKILCGEKTIEVRKSKPKLVPPFKCYIYCTGGKPLYLHKSRYCCDHKYVVRIPKYGKSASRSNETPLNGKVIGEFVCDEIITVGVKYSDPTSRLSLREFPFTCLTDRQIMDYLGNGVDGYGWHISNLKIYGRPKDITEFAQCHRCQYYAYCRDRELSCDGTYVLHRPPQSWCYVENMDADMRGDNNGTD